MRDAITEAVVSYNTGFHESIGRSPSSLVFSYQTWGHPEASDYRPDVAEGLFPDVERFRVASKPTKGGDGNVPQPGESWYIPSRKTAPSALDPRRVVAKLVDRYDDFSFWANVGSTLTRVSLRELTSRVVDPPSYATPRPQSIVPDEVANVPGGPRGRAAK